MKKKIKQKSILILGASGMIGSTIFKYLSENQSFNVFGTIRNPSIKKLFTSKISNNLIIQDQFHDLDKWLLIFKTIQPNIVINCLGITKHNKYGNDPLIMIPLNSYFPHHINAICDRYESKLIHISSDCVFSGKKGGYLEIDCPDAQDYYGRSKALGEVSQKPALTLRTSTIGHELCSSFGLLEWFLNQKYSCKGFKHAYFSGVTTFELAKIIEHFIIPNPQLQGLYHVGASRISKFDLLSKIANIYKKRIKIIPSFEFKIDRSLNSSRFYEATGYQALSWSQMLKEMHLFK